MRTRTILIIATFIMSFTGPSIVYSADGRICQKGIYVYFGNGVWNTENAADASRRLLQRRLETKISGTDLDGILTYGVSYNPAAGPLADLLETFEQNLQTDYSQFWRYLATLDVLPDYLQDKLKAIANEFDASIVQGNPAVQQHIAKYNKHLSEGNKVVVVSHSQGNLFANIAYLGIKSEYRGGFGIVSVGNPDNFVAGGGPYTTLEEDIIIRSVPNSLPANLDNFFLINLFDLTGHTFAKSYMASGHQAETKILNDAVNIINALSFPDSTLENGIITATLTWGSNYDLDLHVFEPNGSHVYYRNLSGISGSLDIDDTDGYGPEHYFVSCDTLETGTYRFGVNYFYGVSPEIGTLTLQTGDQIRSRQHTFTQWLRSSGEENPVIMFELNVTGSQEEGYEFVVY